MEQLSIGEVARQAGIRPSTLRYYESIGLLPAPKRVNGCRRYEAAIVQRLTVLHLAKQAGFSIPEIQMLFHGFRPETPPARRHQRAQSLPEPAPDPLLRQRLVLLKRRALVAVFPIR